jgi:hypothetical protein
MSHYSPSFSPSISSPSTIKIWTNSSNSSTLLHTSDGNTTCIHKCDCNYDILHILHILWVLPLLFLFGVLIGRKINTYRIQGIPAIQYFMSRRSNSWPRLNALELSNIESITESSQPTRSQSEPTFFSVVV